MIIMMQYKSKWLICTNRMTTWLRSLPVGEFPSSKHSMCRDVSSTVVSVFNPCYVTHYWYSTVADQRLRHYGTRVGTNIVSPWEDNIKILEPCPSMYPTLVPTCETECTVSEPVMGPCLFTVSQSVFQYRTKIISTKSGSSSQCDVKVPW